MGLREGIAAAVGRYFEALDRLDVDATVACFAADGELECVSDGRRARGDAELREFLHGVVDGSHGMVHEVTTLVVDPETRTAAAEQHYRDERADGRVYDERTVNLFELDDECRLVRVRFWRGGPGSGAAGA